MMIGERIMTQKVIKERKKIEDSDKTWDTK